MLLNKVESIEVSEPAFGRMLGYGTIVVIGTGGTPEPFQKVAHPLEFRSQVQQQIEKLRLFVSLFADVIVIAVVAGLVLYFV